ncbi:MAG: hypothetical protein KAT32_03850, partial [Candidatus Moranbacteria bacterium]|nr:hypothetical protein [Candidatus Moranbacteria bacterium]
ASGFEFGIVNKCCNHNIMQIADIIREIKGFPFEIHSSRNRGKYKFTVKLDGGKIATFNISCDSSCANMKKHIIQRIGSIKKRNKNCPNSDMLTQIEKALLKK